MKQIVILILFLGSASFYFSQSSSERFFESCQSKNSNAEICQCMNSKKETLKISLSKEFDSLIKTAREILIAQKDKQELYSILKKQIELLSILKNTMIQNALKIGELRASSSISGSGYSCVLAEEQFQELDKIKIFLQERKEELESFR
jgi:hypothetical protein